MIIITEFSHGFFFFKSPFCLAVQNDYRRRLPCRTYKPRRAERRTGRLYGGRKKHFGQRAGNPAWKDAANRLLHPCDIAQNFLSGVYFGV
jgi:hypothetical protein